MWTTQNKAVTKAAYKKMDKQVNINARRPQATVHYSKTQINAKFLE